jgi:hypothetical protein
MLVANDVVINVDKEDPNELSLFVFEPSRYGFMKIAIKN